MAQWPDLLVIDGGKEQLKVVLDILETLVLDIPVVSLAKRFEEVYLPHQEEPLVLDRRSPGLQLLQRARDEAHRFGITYQRKLREQGQTDSLLDTVPGIGPTSAKRIITQRRVAHVPYEGLAKMGVVMKRARYFLTCGGHFCGDISMYPENIKRRLRLQQAAGGEQLTLWEDTP